MKDFLTHFSAIITIFNVSPKTLFQIGTAIITSIITYFITNIFMKWTSDKRFKKKFIKYTNKQYINPIKKVMEKIVFIDGSLNDDYNISADSYTFLKCIYKNRPKTLYLPGQEDYESQEDYEKKELCYFKLIDLINQIEELNAHLVEDYEDYSHLNNSKAVIALRIITKSKRSYLQMFQNATSYFEKESMPCRINEPIVDDFSSSNRNPIVQHGVDNLQKTFSFVANELDNLDKQIKKSV